MRWKSAMMPGAFKNRHRSNRTHGSPSDNEREARVELASWSTNKGEEGIYRRGGKSGKAPDSMRFSREFDSNEIDENDSYD
jgi:hypothetical protein